MNQLKNIENEIKVLSTCDHENVVRLVDKMKSTNHYYLVLEYCNGGTMHSYLEMVGRLTENVGRVIAK